MNSLRIAIIGVGPGGLTLARLLQHSSIPYTIFELEASRHTRSQGGTLDIHRESGQEALREAGLIEQFRKHMRVEGSALKVVNKDGNILLAAVDEEDDERAEGRPEIDRKVLRDILLDSVDSSSILWGKKLLRVKSSPLNQFTLNFADGDIHSNFDLVIGADGAWSRVRSLVTSIIPFYSGISGIETQITDIDTRYPLLSSRVGKGSYWVLGGGKTIMVQRNGDGSVRVYAMHRSPEDWAEKRGIDVAKREVVVQMMLNFEFSGWSEDVKELVRCGGELIERQLWMMPIGVKWDSKLGVTLLGDAAHLMTPFAGVGVNLAMADALDLAHAIQTVVANKISLQEAIQKYETTMFERAAGEAVKTFASMNMFFGEETAEEIVGKLKVIMHLD